MDGASMGHTGETLTFLLYDATVTQFLCRNGKKFSAAYSVTNFTASSTVSNVLPFSIANFFFANVRNRLL